MSWYLFKKFLYFCTPNANGFVAEWLGSGLQNRVQRFDSARNLPKPVSPRSGFFYFELPRVYSLIRTSIKVKVLLNRIRTKVAKNSVKRKISR